MHCNTKPSKRCQLRTVALHNSGSSFLDFYHLIYTQLAVCQPSEMKMYVFLETAALLSPFYIFQHTYRSVLRRHKGPRLRSRCVYKVLMKNAQYFVAVYHLTVVSQLETKHWASEYLLKHLLVSYNNQNTKKQGIAFC